MNATFTFNTASPAYSAWLTRLGSIRHAIFLWAFFGVLFSVFWLWRDSLANRSAFTLYTPAGFVTTVHHGGNIAFTFLLTETFISRAKNFPKITKKQI